MSAVLSTQRLHALDEANRVKLGAAELKKEIKVGLVTFAQALEDPRAQPLTVAALLLAQLRWGRKRMLKVLGVLRVRHQCPISETRRVRDLTDRQRQLLLAVVEREGRRNDG